jgi:hypothetical protein
VPFDAPSTVVWWVGDGGVSGWGWGEGDQEATEEGGQQGRKGGVKLGVSVWKRKEQSWDHAYSRICRREGVDVNVCEQFARSCIDLSRLLQ